VLAARIGVAVVAIPVLLVIIWLGGPLFWIVAMAAAGVAAREAWHLLGSDDAVWSTAATIGAAGIVASAAAGPSILVAALAIILGGMLTLELVMSPGVTAGDQTSGGRSYGSAGLAAATYAGLPIALLVLMRGWPGPDLPVATMVVLARGAAWVIFTFSVVWIVDTAAFFVGSLFGRHLLWPRVSPRKTWEGTAAGLLAGTLATTLWGLALGLGPAAPLLGLVLSTSAVVGDLAESGLKRTAGVKDASGLLPGHGGLLDRLDSLGFATIVVFFSGVLLEKT
jgi:phosphatidate cytidylyltransferase